MNGKNPNYGKVSLVLYTIIVTTIKLIFEEFQELYLINLVGIEAIENNIV